MKIKISLLLIITSFGLQSIVVSQTEQFKKFVGGNGTFKSNASYSYSNITFNTGYYLFNISPKFGLFIVKNLALGLDGNYYFSKYSYENQVTKNYSLGPFMRYYFRIKKSAIILEAEYNYGKGTSDVLIFNSSYYGGNIIGKSKSTLNLYSGGLGYCYFLKENISLELMYQFQHIENSAKTTFSNSYYPITSKNTEQIHNINIGLLFYF